MTPGEQWNALCEELRVAQAEDLACWAKIMKAFAAAFFNSIFIIPAVLDLGASLVARPTLWNSTLGGIRLSLPAVGRP